MTLLGVNIDHVATLRNARGGTEPDPVEAALAAEKAGADSIVCHVREDRRHIRDDDLRRLRKAVTTSLQLEMAPAEPIVRLALEVHPLEVMLVPERRQEVTTEGGLDCIAHRATLAPVIGRLLAAGMGVSIFVDAEPSQVAAARDLGAQTVELHTGPYSHAHYASDAGAQLTRLHTAALAAAKAGLHVHAGHGLNYDNIGPLLAQVAVAKVNIGHSVISRAVFCGLDAAVREMKGLVRQSSGTGR